MITTMKKSLLASALCLIGGYSHAAQYQIDIQNLSRGIYITPLLVAAHTDDTAIFETGSAASDNLQMMAEGGDISGLVTQLNSGGATLVENPAAGLLAPGKSTSLMISNDDSPDNMYLSIAGMMLPTNDGFAAINRQMLPANGEITFMAYAYDAGTEANNEVRGGGGPGEVGFPVPSPLEAMIGMNGSGLTTNAEGFVHIHRGVIGDTDAAGGMSDINASLHRWLNPVLKVTVSVK